MQGLAQRVWREQPQCVDVTVAELAYQGALALADPSDESVQRIWVDEGDAVAWAWFWPPGALDWQIRPDRPELLVEILEWFETIAERSNRLTTHVRAGDGAAEEQLRAYGFRHDPDAPWMLFGLRDFDALEKSGVIPGYRFRTVGEDADGVKKRVAVHRAAWAEFGTRVNEETYASVMATWPYRPDLDVYVETSDGIAVAFALAWYDEANHLGELEPVGTHPAFRRLGLGRAASLFALEKLRDAGATRALVSCRGDAGHPTPWKLYSSLCFREFSRQKRYAMSRQ
jgi:ribosomal protein S18 acetylase RimI-like enzyme